MIKLPKKYVLGFYFSTDCRRVALIRKTKPEWQAGKLNGIGGKVEEGETPLTAMCREFFEETGTVQNEWYYFALMKNTQFDVYCYTSHGDLDSLITTTEEEVTIVTVELLQVHPVLSNLHWLIPMALDSGAFEPVTIDYKDADKYFEK